LSQQYNFAVEGGLLLDYLHDIDASNTIDEKPIYYYLNQHDKIVPNDAAYVVVVNSTKITAQNLNLTKNGQGIIFANTCKSVIANITSSKNSVGILMRWSICNEVSGNSLESNGVGISLDRSNRTFIFENNVTSSRYGICISPGSNNTILHNTLTNNTSGVSMRYSVHNYVLKNKVSGIEIHESDDNVVERNHITPGRGTWLLAGIGSCIILYHSDKNTLVANTFANITHVGQGVSLVLEESDYNKIYHNNFTLHLSSGFLHVVPIDVDDNFFDDDNRGNYWNDYTGEDLDSDGIGDTTYSIVPVSGHMDQDNFPLIDSCTSRYLLYCDMDHDGKVNVIDRKSVV